LSKVYSSPAVLKAIATFSLLGALLFLATISAKADWRDDLGTFRLGIVSQGNSASTVARVEPFRLAVQETLGVNVSVIPFSNLLSLISAHSDGRIEQAILPATAYAATWQACECVEPLAVTKAFDQSSEIRSIIVVRNDSAITSPSALAGKKIMALSENSLASYGYPKFALAVSGTDLSAQNTEFVFAETARDAIVRFLAGEGDALFGWTSRVGDAAAGYSRGSLKRLAELNEGTTNGYRTIWASEPIPHRVHSIKKSLNGEAKTLLRDLMFGLNENDPIVYDAIEPIYSGGFAAIKQSAFNSLVEYVKSPNAKSANEETKPGAGSSGETEAGAEPSATN